MSKPSFSNGQGHRDYKNFQSASPMPSTITLPLTIRAILLAHFKWTLKNTAHGIMRKLLRIFYPILNLLFLVKFLTMVLTWPAIQYPTKVASIIGIWTIHYLIPPTEAKLLIRHMSTREGHDSLCIRDFHK